MFARVMTRTALGVGALLGAFALIVAPGVSLSAAACGVVVGILGLRWIRDVAPGDAASKARAGRRGGLIVGTSVTGGWLAFTGLVLLLGSASGPALLLLLITLSVWLWRRSRCRTAPHVSPWRTVQDGLLRAAQRPHQVTPPPSQVPCAAPVPADLSTPELCLAWQRTYLVLLDVSADTPRDNIVALRGRLLDEIERRDPAGFTRWLETGARAGSDPGQYLRVTDTPPPMTPPPAPPG
jgi:hypothetical protein